MTRSKSVRFAAGVIATAVALLALAWDWPATGIDVSPAEANAALHQRFAVPTTARGVRFASTPRHSDVTFVVDPADFTAWARSQGFRTTAIDPEEPAAIFRLDESGTRRYEVDLSREGVRFDEPGGCGIAGVYDSRRRLCCAWFSCR